MGRSGPRGLFVGLATVDVLSRVAETPPRNGKVTAVRQDVAGGGPALNAAAVFAALGGRAVLAAPVGESALGRVVHEDLAVCGVELIDLAPPGFAPPVSSVTVHAPSGDRQVVSFDGSGYPDAVPPIRADDVDVVLLDGHGPAAARAAIRGAVTAGVPTVVDAGRWRPVFAELLPLATHAVCSADFALPDSVQRPAVFAVTDGAGPIRYHDHGAVGTVEVPPVPVVDTLGAGDVLHGAYAFAIARGESARDALRFAAGHASAKCRYPGVRAWMETL